MVSLLAPAKAGELPRLENECQRGAGIQLVQEAGLSLSSIVGAQARSELRGYKLLHGAPARPRLGAHSHPHTPRHIKNEGVAELTATWVRARSYPLDHPREIYLYESRLVHHIVAPIGRRGAELHLYNVYGHAGARSAHTASGAAAYHHERLLDAVFTAAASLGPVPVVVAGDFQDTADTGPALAAARANGLTDSALRWTALGEPPPATRRLGGSQEEAQRVVGNGSPRLDAIYLNAWAAPSSAALAYLWHDTTTDHVPLLTTLRIQPLQAQYWSLSPAPALGCDVPDMPMEDTQHLARREWEGVEARARARGAPSFARLLRGENPEPPFLRLVEATKRVLQARGATPALASRGRAQKGHIPKRRLRTVLPPASRRNAGKAAKLLAHVNALDRLMGELAFVACRNADLCGMDAAVPPPDAPAAYRKRIDSTAQHAARHATALAMAVSATATWQAGPTWLDAAQDGLLELRAAFLSSTAPLLRRRPTPGWRDGRPACGTPIQPIRRLSGGG